MMAGRIRLTRTGAGLLVAGIACYAGGVLLGYRTLTTIALGGLALLLVAGLAVLIRPQVDLARTVKPARLTAGEPALGRLTVHNVSRWPAPGFVAVDRIDGEPAEHPVASIRPGGGRTVHYEIPTRRRGLLRLGPLTVRRADPFGLFYRDQRQTADDRIWVHPRIRPMRALPVGKVPDFEGQRTQAAHSGTMTFSTLREYHPGDDPRRIHWRTTARTDALMVREHIDTTEPTTTVVLDTRAQAMAPDDFEHAVELVASIADAALRKGSPATVVVTGEDPDELARLGVTSLMDRLAAVQQADRADPDVLLATVRRLPAGGALVVLTGDLGGATLARLGEQRRRFAPVVVLTVVGAAEHAEPRSYRRSGMSVLAVRNAAEGAVAWDRLVLGEL